MNKAELIEAISRKATELDVKRSKNASSAELKILEDEIKGLQSSLSQIDAKKGKRQVFLDECAG